LRANSRRNPFQAIGEATQNEQAPHRLRHCIHHIPQLSPPATFRAFFFPFRRCTTFSPLRLLLRLPPTLLDPPHRLSNTATTTARATTKATATITFQLRRATIFLANAISSHPDKSFGSLAISAANSRCGTGSRVMFLLECFGTK